MRLFCKTLVTVQRMGVKVPEEVECETFRFSSGLREKERHPVVLHDGDDRLSGGVRIHVRTVVAGNKFAPVRLHDNRAGFKTAHPFQVPDKPFSRQEVKHPRNRINFSFDSDSVLENWNRNNPPCPASRIQQCSPCRKPELAPVRGCRK